MFRNRVLKGALITGGIILVKVVAFYLYKNLIKEGIVGLDI